MSGRPSAIGFGFQRFGDHPFGSADWAEEVTWKILPPHNRDDDRTLDLSPPEPLRKYVESIKPQIQEIKDRFEQFPNLWDANKVPLAQLPNLGFNFNILLETLKEVKEVIVATITETTNFLDLSTLSIVPPSPIVPGSFRLEVTVSETDRVTRITDNEGGGLVSLGGLSTTGTIDYSDGTLTGITVELKVGSQVFVSFLSSSKDERLQRSEVLNAIQFFLNKGIDQGYVIVGAFSGLLTVVTPLWAESCSTVTELQEDGPTSFNPRFDAFPADVIATDLIFDDFFAEWPRRLDWDDPCRSSWLNLLFTPPIGEEDTLFDNFSAIAETVLIDLERVRPIHVRFNEIRFDGTPAAGGGWTIPVVAESFAAGGGWTIPVTGELMVSSGGWTIPVVATTTP